MPWINLTKNEIERIKEYNISHKYWTGSYSKEDEKFINKLNKLLNPIKIRSRKNKGSNLQKWICEKISKLLNIPYEQSDDQCLIHSREMAQKGTDVILRGKALKEFPFSIECKSSEQFNIKSTVEQAKNNQIKSTEWMVVYKRKSFKNPVVIIEWGVLEKLYKNILTKI